MTGVQTCALPISVTQTLMSVKKPGDIAKGMIKSGAFSVVLMEIGRASCRERV